MRTRAILVALPVTAALFLSGCAGADAAGSEGEGSASGLRVVATTTQVADFTRNVVGDTPGVTVTQLIQPNQSSSSSG